MGWSWIFNLLRLASGMILLPLVLRKFSKEDLGMYYGLLTLTGFVPMIDFGFGPSITRFVSYATAGAQSLQAHGLAKHEETGKSGPNYELLWQLLFTTRRLYAYLSLVLFVVLAVGGTIYVEYRIEQTSSVLVTRIAWGLTLLAAVLDIYSNWWGLFLRGMNEVLLATRIGVFSMMVRLVIAAGLLLGGAGLISLPAGSLCGSVVNRFLCRHFCLRRLQKHPAPQKRETTALLKTLWPNSWRIGLQYLSTMCTVSANTFLCTVYFGLQGNARYNLSVQLVGILAGMAAVWTMVKWPLIGQYRARHDLVSLRKVLWPRVWLQNLTFLAGAGALLLVGPYLLSRFGHGKEMLSAFWLGLLVLNSFLDMQFNIWGILLTLENRVPYLWPVVFANMGSLVLTLVLLNTTKLGLGALILGPLISGAVFNYWYWPSHSAKQIGTNLLRFLFSKPAA